MLRDSPVKTVTSFSEFLEFESNSQERHEFVDGNLFVMAGGTDRHNYLINRLIILLFEIAIAHRGILHQSDVLVRTKDGKGYYPDVFILFDKSLDSPRVKHYPSIIIEVLSNSTELIDRGEKWQAYQQIPSLEQYVLLSQKEPVAEVFSRDGADWRYKKLEGDAALVFPSLEFEVKLSSLFENLPPSE
jgi:Uma2 family endonuclease